MIRNDLQLPPGEVCWPELFQEAGRATHYVGKWRLDGPDKLGFVPFGWRRRGFATFEGFNRGHVYHELGGGDDSGRPLSEAVPALPDPYYEPARQAELVMDFMRRHRQEPFVCYLSWGPPHTPFRPPKAFERYGPGDIVPRANVPSEHRKRSMRELAGYYGLCESLNHQMGRLTTFLEETVSRNNTLVVFTADHGKLAGSHGMHRKGQPQDEALHVPLLMRLPSRIPAGIEPQTLINSIDLVPTLMSLCALPQPETRLGRDLSDVVLSDRDSPTVGAICCEGKVSAAPDAQPTSNSPSQGPWRAIVTARYKPSVRADFAHVENLFDLQEDPLELRNLAGESDAKSVRDALLAELKDWASRSEDPVREKPPSARAQYAAAGR